MSGMGMAQYRAAIISLEEVARLFKRGNSEEVQKLITATNSSHLGQDETGEEDTAIDITSNMDSDEPLEVTEPHEGATGADVDQTVEVADAEQTMSVEVDEPYRDQYEAI
ncbi:hypothetical protein PInf_019914 [Phytophthora infestans]|nr:hypothetical protein PInf_019914 [Phytophthora infestans]